MLSSSLGERQGGCKAWRAREAVKRFILPVCWMETQVTARASKGDALASRLAARSSVLNF